MRHLPRVLIVEDESAIAELIAVNLRHNGLSPIWAEDGERAQREIDTVLPDVILLDWMLPGQSGVSLARKWRADPRTKAIPILMLTARTDENDKVSGLDAGADDWAAFDSLAGLPVLSLRGELSDVFTAATQAEMQRRLPGLTAVTVPRVGHMPTLAEPVAAGALAQFLDGIANAS